MHELAAGAQGQQLLQLQPAHRSHQALFLQGGNVNALHIDVHFDMYFEMHVDINI